MEKLTKEAHYNLSQLLLSTDHRNVELGKELLKNYTDAVAILYRELILIWQLNEDQNIRKSSHQLLKTTFTKAELAVFKKGFNLFLKIADVYTYNAKVQKWIDAHEAIRMDYMPLIAQNSAYSLKYYDLAYRLHQYLETCLDLAEAYYRIALKGNPEHTSTLFYLAFLLSHSALKDKKEEAVELYLKGLQIRPKNTAILTNLGTLYKQLKSFQLSYKYYSEALALKPNSGVYMGNLGKVCVLMDGEKYQQEARELLGGATKVAPNSGLVWHRWANYLWLEEQDYDAAEAAYLSGLAVAPDDIDLIGNLGELYVDIRGEQDKGLELYKRALEIEFCTYRLITMVTLQVEHYKDYEQGKYYYEELVQFSLPNKITRDSSLTERQWTAFLKAEGLLLGV